MKKFVALLLAVLLVMVNIVALAGPTDEDIPEETKGGTRAETTGTKGHDYFGKTYTIDGKINTIKPLQPLQFEVSVPSGVTNPGSEVITVVDAGYTADSMNKDHITFTVPTYAKAGLYKYIIKEKASSATVNNTQGMTYSTAEVHVDVYVMFNSDNLLEATPVVYITDDKTKDDEITNKLEVGSLKVGKEIAGNLANAAKYFQFKVTLESETNKKVYNDITFAPTGTASVTAIEGTTITDNKIAGSGWTKAEFYITTTIEGTVDMQDIPKGVKYTIVETGIGDSATAIEDITKLDDNQPATQLAAINNEKAYYVENEVTTAKQIAKGVNDQVTIKNTKDFEIPTGITLETLPYVLIMAIAVLGAVALFARKREEN